MSNGILTFSFFILFNIHSIFIQATCNVFLFLMRIRVSVLEFPAPGTAWPLE